eukprot:GHVL01016495.1.p1 GENE.GHVL01016495.1~~GHVL01016495.1.p1  ORF type:complete len:110 (-),score=15.00 GHVL01016495.1:659-988(-)
MCEKGCVPPHRTELYNKSFVLSTTRTSNSLPDNIKSTKSISQFKHFLGRSDSRVPPQYYYGKRKEGIIHCRLRLEMSDLNDDMMKRHLSDNPTCECGHRNEDVEHYLLF